MSIINIGNLHQELEDRQAKQNRIYEQVFRKVVDKIKYVNSQSTECQCLYTLPAFMFGVPLYEINACRDYILARLNAHHFSTNFMPPNIIYINWQQRPVRDDDLGRTRLLNYPTHVKNPQIGYLDTSKPLTLMELNDSLLPPDPEEEKQNIFNKIDNEFINKNTMNAGLVPQSYSKNNNRGLAGQSRSNLVMPIQRGQSQQQQQQNQYINNYQSNNQYQPSYLLQHNALEAQQYHQRVMPEDLDNIISQLETPNNPGGINGILL